MEHRSNSHPYTVRMKKKSMTATVIVVLLSIVLIAGIIAFSPIGDYLSEHVFNPMVSVFTKKQKADSDIVSALKSQEASAAPTTVPTPVQNSFTIVETPFYLLQMGVFTEQAQAEEHAQKLRSMGGAGMVYQDGEVYRVFAAAYRDEASLKKVQSQVRTDGFEATPYISEQKSVHITLKGDRTALNTVEQAIMLLTEVPNTLSDLSLSLDKETVDGAEYRQSLNELSDRISELLNQFQTFPSDSIKPFQTILEKYRNRISTFLREHDTITKMNASECKLLQIECITDYILFFEQE